MFVMKFIAWMEKAPASARAGAVEPLVRSLFRPDIGAEDRETLETTLTMLLDDPAVEVRRALAEALSRQEAAPRHLIVALAADLPLVAEPIFARSPCLLDSELVEAVDRGLAVQTAIARRPWVSFAVSEALAAEGDHGAVLTLVNNPGSDIDEIAFRTVVTRFPGDPDLREALFARPDLPLSVRQSLIAGLGARLTDLMVSRSWITPRRADTIVREACERATAGLAAEAGERDLSELVHHLRATGQLTTALLIRCICHGQLRFLEAALAMLADMPAARVYPILADGREGALRALFRKAGLPERSHPAFVVALEAWRETDYDGAAGDRARFARRMIERILTRYQQFHAAEVDDLVALLRRLATEAARDAARSAVDAARDAARPDIPRIAAA